MAGFENPTDSFQVHVDRVLPWGDFRGRDRSIPPPHPHYSFSNSVTWSFVARVYVNHLHEEVCIFCRTPDDQRCCHMTHNSELFRKRLPYETQYIRASNNRTLIHR